MGRHGLFTAEQLAASFSLSVKTINDYARLGLIRPITLNDGVYFAGGEFARLEVIAKGKCLGFTLGALRLLIESAGNSAQPTPLVSN